MKLFLPLFCRLRLGCANDPDIKEKVEDVLAILDVHSEYKAKDSALMVITAKSQGIKQRSTTLVPTCPALLLHSGGQASPGVL